MRFFRMSCILIALGQLSTAYADNLQQVYELAKANDPTLQAAYAAMQADKQAFPEALSQMGPNFSGNYQTAGNINSIFGHYNTRNYGLTLNQPLFHPEQWAQLEGSRHVVKGAKAAYGGAYQALMLRAAEGYFAVLRALDELNFAQGQRREFARYLDQTQQRFDVGLIAITDVQEAKARHDGAIALEILTNNQVFDSYEKLREITGIPVKNIIPLGNKKLDLIPPKPDNIEEWVNLAHLNNLEVMAAREKAKQAKANIGTQVSGHFPKFDLQGNLVKNKGQPPFPFDELTYDRNLTLYVTIPIFASGGTIFRTQEARSRYEEAMKILERTQRITDSETRQAYRGVLTAIASVKSLAQLVISNKTALEATQASYEVGTRTMVDVLNAQSALLRAERDYAQARYEYLLQGLRLKQATGTLSEEDILEVNNLMN